MGSVTFVRTSHEQTQHIHILSDSLASKGYEFQGVFQVIFVAPDGRIHIQSTNSGKYMPWVLIRSAYYAHPY